MEKIYDDEGQEIGYRKPNGQIVIKVTPNSRPQKKPTTSEIARDFATAQATKWGLNQAGKFVANQLGQEGAKQAGAQLGGKTVSAGIGKVALPVAGAYGMYDLLTDDSFFKRKAKGKKLVMNAAQGAASGAAIGSAIPGVGTGIGAVVGGLIGTASNFFGGAKHEDQYMRDDVRSSLKDAGILNSDFSLTLSDGSSFDMGKDGNFRYADGFRAYEVDHSDETQSKVFGTALPIAQMLTGGDEKLSSDYAGYLTRAAIQSGATTPEEGRAQLKGIMDNLGISQADIYKWSEKAVAEGLIEEDQQLYNQTAANILFDRPEGVDPNAGQAVPQEQQAQPVPRPVVGQSYNIPSSGDRRATSRITPNLVSPNIGKNIDWSKVYTNESIAGSLL